MAHTGKEHKLKSPTPKENIEKKQTETAKKLVSAAKTPESRSFPRKKKKKRSAGAVLWFPIALLLVFALCALAFMVPLSDDTLSIAYYEIDTGKLQNDVRIALISDLHNNEFGDKNADLVGAVRMLQPDIIAMCGDMTDEETGTYDNFLQMCKELIQIAPVYFTYGNHEFHAVLFEGSTLCDDLTNVGVHVLNDVMVTTEIRGSLIDIGGLSEDPTQYAEYGKPFIDDFVKSDNLRILITHNPGHYDKRYRHDGAGSLIGTDIDVVLSGHRHGGQVIIPGLGGLFHPDVGFLPDFTEGVTLVDNTHVVVTRGLSGGSPISRINNPPEIVLTVIR